MIHKHSDCRVIAIETGRLHDYRWAMDTALTAVEAFRDAAKDEATKAFYIQRLKLLDELRMAVHEDYG